MTKNLEQLQDLFRCRFCLDVYEQPIILPCGEVICQKDLQSCEFCHESHQQSNRGFPAAKRIKKLLELKVNKLDLNNNTRSSLERSVKHINSTLADLELLVKDPESYVSNYFSELRRQVDIRRETLKANIDAQSQKIIDSIYKCENDCRRKLSDQTRIKSNPELEKELRESKSHVESIKKKIDSLELSRRDLINVADKSRRLRQRLREAVEYIKSQLHDTKEYGFRQNKEDVVFGEFSFNEKLSLESSKVLRSFSEIQELKSLCRMKTNQKWRLLYRASKDGFSGECFHAKCDGYLGTLTLVRTTNSCIFGGYTQADWKQERRSPNIYKHDEKAFLFSLKNEWSQSVVMKCAEPNYAICCLEQFGPIFGGGEDLCIYGDSNASTNSFSSLGCTYKHPIFCYGSEEAKCFLAGTPNFQTNEIEVFYQEI